METTSQLRPDRTAFSPPPVTARVWDARVTSTSPAPWHDETPSERWRTPSRAPSATQLVRTGTRTACPLSNVRKRIDTLFEPMLGPPRAIANRRGGMMGRLCPHAASLCGVGFGKCFPRNNNSRKYFAKRGTPACVTRHHWVELNFHPTATRRARRPTRLRRDLAACTAALPERMQSFRFTTTPDQDKAFSVHLANSFRRRAPVPTSGHVRQSPQPAQC